MSVVKQRVNSYKNAHPISVEERQRIYEDYRDSNPPMTIKLLMLKYKRSNKTIIKILKEEKDREIRSLKSNVDRGEGIDYSMLVRIAWHNIIDKLYTGECTGDVAVSKMIIMDEMKVLSKNNAPKVNDRKEQEDIGKVFGA